MREETYWLWLSMALGQGKAVDEVTQAFSSAKMLYEADKVSRIVSGVFTKQQLNRLDSVSLDDCNEKIELCLKKGWGVVTVDSPNYPRKLNDLRDKPLILFYQGDISLINNNFLIGIVGTRNPSSQGARVAYTLSAEMAKAGAVIVSGGALGIDSAAHEGALSESKPTVCVMGCGFGTNYLMTNEKLRKRISQNGVLITEYPPFTPASRITFPLRNRIISGVSEGIVVVEAGEKSGSLITANYALEQGKDVFAVPGDILNASYTGANKLIRDGANVVTCSEDILTSYEFLYPDKLDLSKIKDKAKQKCNTKTENNIKCERVFKKPLPNHFDETARAIYSLFNGDMLHPNEISASLNIELSAVNTQLMFLELEGLVEQCEGKNYRLKVTE